MSVGLSRLSDWHGLFYRVMYCAQRLRRGAQGTRPGANDSRWVSSAILSLPVACEIWPFWRHFGAKSNVWTHDTAAPYEAVVLRKRGTPISRLLNPVVPLKL
jgi:hypothetical protein